MERAWALLQRISEAYQQILADNLTGIYAHGSLAFGCFSWDKSDIDFLVVTRQEPQLGQKKLLIEELLSMERQAPAKGFEMSVVLEEDCRHAAHPTPFSLHYSNAHRERCQADITAYCQAMHGVDPDLIAHFAVTKAVGQTVYGQSIQKVFGPVCRRDYLDSIRQDLSDAEAVLPQQPVYVVLNMARALAYQREGLILSKAQGGQWGMEHLPEAAEVIRRALEAYTTDEPCEIPQAEAIAFIKKGQLWLAEEDKT